MTSASATFEHLRDLRRRHQLGRAAPCAPAAPDARRLLRHDAARLVHHLLRHRHAHRHLGADARRPPPPPGWPMPCAIWNFT